MQLVLKQSGKINWRILSKANSADWRWPIRFWMQGTNPEENPNVHKSHIPLYCSKHYFSSNLKHSKSSYRFNKKWKIKVKTKQPRTLNIPKRQKSCTWLNQSVRGMWKNTLDLFLTALQLKTQIILEKYFEIGAISAIFSMYSHPSEH